MIPFVRSHGGQVEIVGEENVELLFKDDVEAVEKIVQVLKDIPLQDQLRKVLGVRQELFSTDKFTHDIQSVVSNHFTDRH